MKKLLLTQFFIFFTFHLFCQYSLPFNNFSNCRFTSIAHRGYDHIFPEETSIALIDAFKHTKYIEVDLKLTKDSQYVIFHDESAINRVTNGSGRVEDFTLAQLKRLDAGSYMGSQFKGEPILSLVEGLKLTEKYKGYMYLDFDPLDFNILKNAINASGVSPERVLPNIYSLTDARNLRNAIPKAAWVWYNGGLYPDSVNSTYFYKTCIDLGCVAFEVTSSRVADSTWKSFEYMVHKNNSKVWVFTENDSDVIKSCILNKVDGIENDRPWEVARTVCEPGYKDLYPDSLTTGNWRFDSSLQSRGIGSQIRTKNYINPPASQVPSFNKCSKFGIASPDTSDPVVMYVPNQDANNGLMLYNNFAPQDYGSENRQYSVVMDFLMPDTLSRKFVSLYQTSPSNNVDASLFINPSGQIGVWGYYYGKIDPGKWYRFAFTVDVKNGSLKEYINGKYLGKVAISTKDRWAVLNFITPGERQGFLLFADNDSETAPFYVSSLQIRDYVMDSATIAGLGAPSSAGIPMGNADVFNVKINGTIDDSSLFDYDHQAYYVAVSPSTDLSKATLSYDLSYGASASKANHAVVDFTSGAYTIKVSSGDNSKSKTWKIYARTAIFPRIMDAGLDSITTPLNKFCSGPYTINVKLRNFSTDTLTSIRIGWSINGSLRPVYSWTGKLGKSNTAIVNIGSDSFSTPGRCAIKAWTYNPNTGIDTLNANDSISAIDTILAIPNPKAGNNQSICSPGSTTVGAASISGHSYSWASKPAGFVSVSANPTVSPAINTTYYLTEKITSSGCIKADSVLITVNPNPLAFTGSYKSICYGDSIQIGGAAVSGNTYSWTCTSGWTSNISNPYVSPYAKRTYTLIEKVAATGCSRKDTVSVNVLQVPSRPVFASNNGPFCEGAALKLTSSAVSGAIYNWTSTTGFTSSMQNPVKANITMADSGLYAVSVTIGGCTSAHRYTLVKVYSNPLANTGPNVNICKGTSIYLGGGSLSGHLYTWTPVTGLSQTTSSNPLAKPSVTTTYSLFEKISATGCSKTNFVKVNVNPLPAATVGSNATICKGTSKTLGTTTTAGNTYSWAPATALSSATISNPVATPVATIYYTLTEKITATGCNNSNKVKITVNICPVLIPEDSSNNGIAVTTSLDQAQAPVFGLDIFPNPFRSSTNFQYTIAERTAISIAIYDVNGRQITTLVSCIKERGQFDLSFDAEKYNACAGIYFARIMAGNNLISRKLIIIR